MTRGCTECWEANPERAHWLELSRLPVGATVEFVDPWDIFDSGIVPAGTKAVVKEQGLNEMQPALILESVERFNFLNEWVGLIWLYPPEDFCKGDYAWADESAPAPVKIVNTDARAA